MVGTRNPSGGLTSNSIEPPLPQSVGYIIVVVIGMIIATGNTLPLAMETIIYMTNLSSHDVGYENFEQDCWRGQQED